MAGRWYHNFPPVNSIFFLISSLSSLRGVTTTRDVWKRSRSYLWSLHLWIINPVSRSVSSLWITTLPLHLHVKSSWPTEFIRMLSISPSSGDESCVLFNYSRRQRVHHSHWMSKQHQEVSYLDLASRNRHRSHFYENEHFDKLLLRDRNSKKRASQTQISESLLITKTKHALMIVSCVCVFYVCMWSFGDFIG